MPRRDFATFGDLLKYLRRRARLSQKELSIATGYSESQISRLEKNRRKPDPSAVAALFVPALDIERDPELRELLVELAQGRPQGSRSPFGAQRPSGSDTPGGHLPHLLTSFVGRVREVTALLPILAESRLVTLTGPGGVGKTRLALRIAEEALRAYPDGAWFVELAPLGSPALIPQTIAAALGIQARDRPVEEVLAENLRGKTLLLILDNCEHLLAGIAALTGGLLANCRRLHVLATSREALNLAGEVVFRVPPLRLPALGWAHLRERVAETEAVQLFVERARAGRLSFSLTDENAAAVTKICARLDGIPLAIELAAARIRHLQPDEIAARLEDRFTLLSSGPRDLPDRHRTLQAVMDWSYSLLDPDEQRLLHRLSVFAGSFSLDAALANGGASREQVLDLLARLVDKSLVLAEPLETGTRYRLLEIVRQYALGKLRETGAEAAARERHARFYLSLAEAAQPKLTGSGRTRTVRAIEQEYAELRSALEWAGAAGEGETALRLVGALLWFWHFRDYVAEGRGLAEAALGAFGSLEPGHPARAALGKVRWVAGLLAWIQADLPHSHARFEEAIAVLRPLAGPEDRESGRMLAHAVSNLGMVVLDEGEPARANSLTAEGVALARRWGKPWDLALLLYNAGEVTYVCRGEAAARPLLEESLRLFRGLEDNWGVSIPSFLFGLIAGEKGDFAAARTHFEMAARLQREEGDAWGAAEALLLLGQAAQELGDLKQAAGCYTESLRLNAEKVGDRSTLVRTLYSLAYLTLEQGEPERAVRFMGAFTALREASGAATRRSILVRDDEQTIESLRTALGPTDFEAAWAEGRATTMEQLTDPKGP